MKTLFYGISLERIPLKRNSIAGIDLEQLESLLNKSGIKVFIKEQYMPYRDRHVHVGTPIKESSQQTYEEYGSYNTNQIVKLEQDPSELIAKLRKIGIDAKKEDFRLYITNE